MLEVINNQYHLIIRPRTNINSDTVEHFKTEILKEVQNKNKKTLILDFLNIKEIDSLGCGVILWLYKKLLNSNIFLELVNVSNSIFNLFKITRIDRLIKINNF